MFFTDLTLTQMLGQMLIGVFFLIMIVKNIRVWDFNMERTGAILPFPAVALIINFILQFVSALTLLADYYDHVGAIVLIVLTIMATAMFHRFWRMDDPLRRTYHMLLFTNNIAIVGALVMII